MDPAVQLARPTLRCFGIRGIAGRDSHQDNLDLRVGQSTSVEGHQRDHERWRSNSGHSTPVSASTIQRHTQDVQVETRHPRRPLRHHGEHTIDRCPRLRPMAPTLAASTMRLPAYAGPTGHGRAERIPPCRDALVHRLLVLRTQLNAEVIDGIASVAVPRRG